MSRLPMDRSRVREVVLVRHDRSCPACGAKMRVQCERTRVIHTLQGPVRLIIKLLQCRNTECDSTTNLRSGAGSRVCYAALGDWLGRFLLDGPAAVRPTLVRVPNSP